MNHIEALIVLMYLGQRKEQLTEVESRAFVQAWQVVEKFAEPIIARGDDAGFKE